MAGTATVCSMCGDVGFPEKLFRCARCRHRFQHSYCTNYYGDGAPASAGSDTCDWCLSDVSGKARWSPTSAAAAGKQHASGGSLESTSTTSSGSGKGKSTVSGGDQRETGRRATRPGGRRYKLLKDVLC
ncbi:hypothetical protein EJB05_38461 [Eragrostis curvula]|uniref:PHD-type zinc finger plants domain-containing protein n=1 Tax=Eragrostis curvula TaxID=38414 RepID=A0A5J9SQY7_9POAL|nr:hypothetical protein EJB05_53136 [Eragrostis curvula]TVU14964.1 hypothetical protein EJB05_38461 [Eragrostis curvula]